MIKKSSGQIFHVTIAYPKENSKIKEKYPEIGKTYFWLQNGGSTYTRVDLYKLG